MVETSVTNTSIGKFKRDPETSATERKRVIYF